MVEDKIFASPPKSLSEFMKGEPIPDFFDGKPVRNPLEDESRTPAGPVYVFRDGRLVKDRTYQKNGEVITVTLNEADKRKISEKLSGVERDKKKFVLNGEGIICYEETGRPVSVDLAKELLAGLSL